MTNVGDPFDDVVWLTDNAGQLSALQSAVVDNRAELGQLFAALNDRSDPRWIGESAARCFLMLSLLLDMLQRLPAIPHS